MPVDLDDLEVVTDALGKTTAAVALDDLVAPEFCAPKAWQSQAPETSYAGLKPPVQWHPEIQRIIDLPRRAPIDMRGPKATALVKMMTARYTNGRAAGDGCDCESKHGRPCIVELRPAQAIALYEMRVAGGFVGSLAVGIGKCVDAATEVFDHATGRRRRADEPGPLQVTAASEALRLSAHDATAFPSGQKSVVRMTLANGSAVTVSADHRIRTERGWISAGDIQPGELVAVPARLPEPTSPTQASDDEVAFVAYMLSDGGCSQRMAGFTNMTPAIIDDWQRVSRALGYEITECPSKSRARQFRLLTGRQRALTGPGNFVHVPDVVRERWGLYGLAKHKRAHADIWGLPRRQVAMFINRFWACDGHVSATTLEITLASPELIDDLRHLLLRLGVQTSKRFKSASYVKDGVHHHFDAWRLTVCGDAARTFLSEVGDVLGKEDACQRLRAQLGSRSSNPNNDVVPVGQVEMRAACRAAGLPLSAAKRWGTTKGQQLSRRMFQRFVAETGYVGPLLPYASPDIAWSPVTTVEPLDVRPVYDLCVPGPHNFVANNILVHNTALDILAPLAVPNVRTAVLLVPPKLVDPQLLANYEQLANHFKVPSLAVFGSTFYRHVEGAPTLYVLPYSLLSREHYTAKLAELQPDLIIADEVQNIRNRDSTRSGRLLWYKHHNPRVSFACWSGSLSDKRIQDYGHLMAMALGLGSPLPHGEKAPEVLEDMSRAINPSDYPAPPGPLVALCPPKDELPHLKGQRRLWHGWRKRLQETEGVVFTSEASITAELQIEERKAPTIPHVIKEHLRKLRNDWIRPDGEELVDALSVARTARELACGFHLYWYFPPIHGVEQEVETILDWLDARKWWRKEVREEVKKHTPHMDSPLLLTRAAMRHHGDIAIRDVVDVLDANGVKIGEQPGPDLPVWASECWPRWRDTRTSVVYETRCQRIDPFLAQDAADWARSKRGVVWYQSRAFGQWIAELSGLPTFGAGHAKQLHEYLARGAPTSMIASSRAHGTGTDGLQYHYDESLFTQAPTSGEQWAQIVGRLHRPGQASEKTTHGVYRHTKEMAAAVDEAISRGEYQTGTLGASHPLVDGNYLDDLPQAWDEDNYDEDE